MRLSTGILVKLVIFMTLLFGVVSTEIVAAEGLARTESASVESAVGQEFVKAWEVLDKAGRTGLKTNVEALEALSRLRSFNPSTLQKLGLTDEVLPFLEGRRAYKEILGDFEKLAKKLDKNPGTQVENFDGIIARLDRRNKLVGGSGYSSSQIKGADGVVRAFADDVDDYIGKKITFEKTVQNARDMNSKSFEDLQVEIELPTGATGILKRVEVKNCADCVTSSVIKHQFIDRDLFNATSLDQIRWRIYEQPFSKSHLNGFLTSNRTSIEALGIDKVRQLLPDFADSINNTNYTDFLIGKLNEDKFFNAIFR